MMSKHTPLPWEVRTNLDDVEIVQLGVRNRVPIATRDLGFNDDVDKESIANAAFIVTACNSHYGLLEALKEARTDLMLSADNARDAAKTDPRWSGVADVLMARCEKIDAALAKAGA